MPTQTIKARLKFARKATAEWEAETRILLAGEPAIEVLEDGTEKEKRGDGVSLWADLPYVSGGGGGSTDLSVGTRTTTTLVLASSTGADATLPAASTTEAGLMPAAAVSKLDGLAAVATSGAYSDLSGRPTLGTAAATDSAAYATAAQGTDAREWSAETVSQAEAEAGTATTRRAWTAQRVAQAIAAWWASSSAASKLAGIATGATANATDAQLRDRSTHTGTQSAGTITGLATVATSGAYGDLSGRPSLGGAASLNVGATAGTVAAGDDSRLSNTRTPTDGTVNDAKITSAGLSQSSLSGVAVAAWAASTAYAKGDLVEYLGISYRRTTAGTSGSTFNVANWQQQSPSAAPAFVAAYRAGNWIWPYLGAAAAGGTTNANVTFFVPFFVWRPVTINRLGARVTTVAASSNFQLAIYAANASGNPTGTPLGSTASLSGATATTVESADLTPFTLYPGQLYFGALNRDSTALAFQTISDSGFAPAGLIGASTLAGLSTSGTAISPNLHTLAQTFGTWPDVTSATFGSLSNSFRAAAVFLRVNSVL